MPIIEVLIFRGTGGIYQSDNPYYDEPALVRAGHVGVRGVIDNTIIGFHPTPEAAAAIGGEDALLDALLDKIPQPSRLQDDDAYFERAYELSDATKGRTTVYMYEVEISEDTLNEIRTWYNESKEALYNFPDADGQFNAGESNCATFWYRFKIPLPQRTGKIKILIKKMSDEGYDTWQPNA